jgi:hypothetical protein
MMRAISIYGAHAGQARRQATLVWAGRRWHTRVNATPLHTLHTRVSVSAPLLTAYRGMAAVPTAAGPPPSGDRATRTPAPGDRAQQRPSGAAKGNAHPIINFETMTSKDLNLFLMAAEASKAVLTRHFDSIAGVLVRTPRFDSPAGLSRVAYTLRDSDGSSADARRLLDILSSKILHANGEFNAIEICKSVAGMRCMPADSPSVRRMVGALGEILNRSKEELQSRSYGTILYSLKHMNSDTPEVRKFLTILASKLECCDFPLDGQCIGNMLFGIRGMDSKHAEVRRLAAAIAFKVPEVPVPMKPQVGI